MTAKRGPVVDSGICCRNCAYNLTGLTILRCPECGLPFIKREPLPFFRLEHILSAANVAAVVLASILWLARSSNDPVSQVPEGSYVWALLAPLQWVLAAVAVFLSLHLWERAGRRWLALAGAMLPLACAASTLSAAW